MGPYFEMVSQPPFLHLGIHIGESIVYICIHNGENFIPSIVEGTLLHWTPSLLTSVLAKPIQLYTKSNGKCLCAATHHFSACKPYGCKLRLYQPNQPSPLSQLNLYNTLFTCLQVELRNYFQWGHSPII